MITNKGVELMGKYIAGQIPIFASHIAIGCGPKSLLSKTEFDNYENKASLDFEVQRLPITSRTVEAVKSNLASITSLVSTATSVTFNANNNFYVGQKVTITGVTPEIFNMVDAIIETVDYDFFTVSTASLVSPPITEEVTSGSAFDYSYQVVTTAQAPESNRYGITEIGIYPAEKSNISGSEDSRFMYSFDNTEPWFIHNATSAGSDLPAALAFYTERLDEGSNGIISVTDKAFVTESDNVIFSSDERLNRQEQPRYLSETMIVAGNLSSVSYDSETGRYNASNHDHVHIENVDLSFLDSASISDDEIRFAFAILNKNGAYPTSPTPGNIKIVVEFSDSDDDGSTAITNWAQIAITGSDGSELKSALDDGNRYVVSKTKLKNIKKSAGFTWSSAKTIRIYVDMGADGANYFVAFDAVKFENMSAIDSQYGLAGYTVIVNPSTVNPGYSRPIIKQSNGIVFIEFRFALDIGGLNATSYSS